MFGPSLLLLTVACLLCGFCQALKSPKSVLVIGATGRVGRNVVPKLLKQGYQVRCLVRNKEKAVYLKELKGSKLVEGDVTNLDCLLAATEGCGTVIAVHGVRPPRVSKLYDLFIHPKHLGSNHPYNVNYLGVMKILAAMQVNRCSKLVRITGSLIDKSAFSPFRVLFNLLLSFTTKWHEASEIAIRRSGVDYTVLRPTGIADIPAAAKDPTRSLILLPGDSTQLPPLPGRIPVEDLGELVVKAAGGALPRTSVVCSSVDARPAATAATTSTAAAAAVPVKAWDALMAAMPADRRQITLGPHKLAVSTYLAGFALVVSALLRLLVLAVTKAVRLVRPA